MFRKTIFYKILTFTLIFTFSAVISLAQNFDNDENPPNDPPENPTQRELLRELGLSQEQFQKIRILNSESKPLRQAAQRRLRIANRELDLAIYADTVNEEEIKVRLKEVQEAHAEVHKLRAMSELEYRKILTPEQLLKFRELRENFAKRLRINQQRRQNRIQNRQNPPPQNMNRINQNRRQNNRPKQ